jgi:peptide/nickel transport system permease protein
MAPYAGASGHFGNTLLILGGDGALGRDLFLRLLYGAQASLEVAVLATLASVALGVIMGVMAGYFKGWVDTVVSRLIEMVMVFPVLLFIIALRVVAGQQLNAITFGGLLARGVFTLALIFSVFGWFYPARIVRGVVLSLREKEFVEAARMTGASDLRIMRSHLLPHLVAPIIVYSTLIVAQNIIAEAGLSFLGLGIELPTASWGNLLANAPEYYLTQPWLMVWPGLSILLTTLAFNLLGDGLRDAFDPRARI